MALPRTWADHRIRMPLDAHSAAPNHCTRPGTVTAAGKEVEKTGRNSTPRLQREGRDRCGHTTNALTVPVSCW